MLVGNSAFPWREFWRHCIGVATLTREAVAALKLEDAIIEAAYVAGLVHDVGRIAMAAVFPTHFAEICRRVSLPGAGAVEIIETEWLGLNHAQIGALYLESHQLPDTTIEAALLHHAPEQAVHQPQIVAAVQIADLLVRFARIGTSGDPAVVLETQCAKASGWNILYPGNEEAQRAEAYAALGRTLKRLPLMLQGVV